MNRTNGFRHSAPTPVPKAPLPFTLPSRKREGGAAGADGHIAGAGAKWASPAAAAAAGHPAANGAAPGQPPKSIAAIVAGSTVSSTPGTGGAHGGIPSVPGVQTRRSVGHGVAHGGGPNGSLAPQPQGAVAANATGSVWGATANPSAAEDLNKSSVLPVTASGASSSLVPRTGSGPGTGNVQGRAQSAAQRTTAGLHQGGYIARPQQEPTAPTEFPALQSAMPTPAETHSTGESDIQRAAGDTDRARGAVEDDVDWADEDTFASPLALTADLPEVIVPSPEEPEPSQSEHHGPISSRESVPRRLPNHFRGGAVGSQDHRGTHHRGPGLSDPSRANRSHPTPAPHFAAAAAALAAEKAANDSVAGQVSGAHNGSPVKHGARGPGFSDVDLETVQMQHELMKKKAEAVAAERRKQYELEEKQARERAEKKLRELDSRQAKRSAPTDPSPKPRTTNSAKGGGGSSSAAPKVDRTTVEGDKLDGMRSPPRRKDSHAGGPVSDGGEANADSNPSTPKVLLRRSRSDYNSTGQKAEARTDRPASGGISADSSPADVGEKLAALRAAVPGKHLSGGSVASSRASGSIHGQGRSGAGVSARGHASGAGSSPGKPPRAERAGRSRYDETQRKHQPDADDPAAGETRDEWLERRRRQTEARDIVRSIVRMCVTRAMNPRNSLQSARAQPGSKNQPSKVAPGGSRSAIDTRKVPGEKTVAQPVDTSTRDDRPVTARETGTRTSTMPAGASRPVVPQQRPLSWAAAAAAGTAAEETIPVNRVSSAASRTPAHGGTEHTRADSASDGHASRGEDTADRPRKSNRKRGGKAERKKRERREARAAAEAGAVAESVIRGSVDESPPPRAMGGVRATPHGGAGNGRHGDGSHRTTGPNTGPATGRGKAEFGALDPALNTLPSGSGPRKTGGHASRANAMEASSSGAWETGAEVIPPRSFDDISRAFSNHPTTIPLAGAPLVPTVPVSGGPSPWGAGGGSASSSPWAENRPAGTSSKREAWSTNGTASTNQEVSTRSHGASTHAWSVGAVPETEVDSSAVPLQSWPSDTKDADVMVSNVSDSGVNVTATPEDKWGLDRVSRSLVKQNASGRPKPVTGSPAGGNVSWAVALDGPRANVDPPVDAATRPGPDNWGSGDRGTPGEASESSMDWMVPKTPQMATETWVNAHFSQSAEMRPTPVNKISVRGDPSKALGSADDTPAKPEEKAPPSQPPGRQSRRPNGRSPGKKRKEGPRSQVAPKPADLPPSGDVQDKTTSVAPLDPSEHGDETAGQKRPGEGESLGKGKATSRRGGRKPRGRAERPDGHARAGPKGQHSNPQGSTSAPTKDSDTSESLAKPVPDAQPTPSTVSPSALGPKSGAPDAAGDKEKSSEERSRGRGGSRGGRGRRGGGGRGGHGGRRGGAAARNLRASG